MPRDSQGNTNPLPGTIVATGDTILPSQHNPALVDLYAMMTQSLSRDGQGGMRANLSMSGYQLTGLAPATFPDNAVPLSQLQQSAPLGSVIDFAGSAAPATWMFCFGQAIDTELYPDFVRACYIGDPFNGNASFGYRTTSQSNPSANRSLYGRYIVLPDLRGRVGAGRDNMGGSNASRLSGYFGDAALALGGNFGESAHILTVTEMPSHNHGGAVDISGQHSHTGLLINVGAAGAGTGVVQSSGGAGRPNLSSAETGLDGLHNHTIPLQGGNGYHTNTQPTIIMNKIIKVSY